MILDKNMIYFILNILKIKEKIMNYEDKKIVGIVASNVEPSVALNVIGHLSVAIGKYSDNEIMGQSTIIDKSFRN